MGEKILEQEKRFFYFDSGYALLGLIAEEIIDAEFSEFVKTRILDPLDMKNSRYEYTEKGI